MASERVTVPNIGDAHDVDVVEVLVAVGATVEHDQALIVLESDKASMEIPSPLAGVVREISVKAGDKVSEGSLILVLEVGAAKAAEPAKAAELAKDSAAKAAPAKAAPAKAVAAAPAADGGEDAPAEPADTGDAEAESETPQALPRPEMRPPAPGPRAPSMQRPMRTIPPAPPVVISQAPKPERPKPHASPAIRLLARELGVDLEHVPGSGEHGRITKDDVQRYVKHAMSMPASTAGAVIIPEPIEIDFSQFGETSIEPLTKIQRVSGKNLHRSWVTIPHVTQFDEADITELEAFRKKMRADHADLKLTLVTFFMKGLAVALKAMPRFNSSLDKSGEHLIMKHYVHIGVAVDTPNGLMVPVIRDVDSKGLADLAKELEVISERARARRLGPADLQGASMTISSLGGIGGTAFTPIINPPEVAVLGVSRAALRPVFQDGSFVPRLMCPLSLSYDHRVIDGADAARFTTRLREIFGDIRQMLL